MKKYVVAAGGNSNADATYSTTSGGSPDTTVPTAADEVILDANSGNLTINAALACRKLDCNEGGSAYAGVLTHNAACKISIGDATAGDGNVALRFSSAMTYTLGNNTTSEIEFVSTSATQQTITSADKRVGRVTFNGAGGSWLTSDRMRQNPFTAGAVVIITQGSVHWGTGLTHEFNGYQSSNSNTRSINQNNNTIRIVGGSGSAQVNFATTTNLTFDPGTSTISVDSGQGGSLDNYGSLTWYNLYAPGSGTCNVLGDNTWNQITAGNQRRLILNGTKTIGTITNDTPTSSAQEIEFKNGVTHTITTWNVHGNSSFKTLIRSTSDGSQHTISKSSGTVNANYLDIRDSVATGGAIFNAINSTDTGNNSGWNFGVGMKTFSDEGLVS